MKMQSYEPATANHINFFEADELPTEPQLTDFDLTDEELDGIKGGPGPRPYSEDGGGGGMGGDWVLNHNETVVNDK